MLSIPQKNMRKKEKQNEVLLYTKKNSHICTSPAVTSISTVADCSSFMLLMKRQSGKTMFGKQFGSFMYSST